MFFRKDLKKVSIRISEEDRKKLERLVNEGYYANISEAIREAIREFRDKGVKISETDLKREKKGFPKKSKKITVRLPFRLYHYLEEKAEEYETDKVLF